MDKNFYLANREKFKKMKYSFKVVIESFLGNIKYFPYSEEIASTLLKNFHKMWVNLESVSDEYGERLYQTDYPNSLDKLTLIIIKKKICTSFDCFTI